jgi:hypothetical protein
MSSSVLEKLYPKHVSPVLSSSLELAGWVAYPYDHAVSITHISDARLSPDDGLARGTQRCRARWATLLQVSVHVPIDIGVLQTGLVPRSARSFRWSVPTQLRPLGVTIR